MAKSVALHGLPFYVYEEVKNMAKLATIGAELARMIKGFGGEPGSNKNKALMIHKLADMAENGEIGGGGGGSTSPLIVTLTPTNPSNPLAGGTHNGNATEMRSAWDSGRKIYCGLANGGALFELTDHDDDKLGNRYGALFVYQVTPGTYVLVRVFIRDDESAYNSDLFTLTAAN
jgi:hypothetical protein